MAKKSKIQEDATSSNPIFDFLYYDSQRVGSFLSQFDRNGHLTSLIRGEAATRSKSDTTSGTIKGQVPLFASGIGSHGFESGLSSTKDGQRSYDPLWSNALSFLSSLNDRNMIERELSGARVGQIVLLSGTLEVTDHHFMQKAWDLEAVQSLIKSGADSGNRESRRRNKKKNHEEPTTDLDLFLQMIKIMPHSIQATMNGTEDVWFSLKNDSLTTSANELVLKHGVCIEGHWHALGILDARPKTEDEILIEALASDRTIEIEDGQQIVANLYATIAPLTRQFLGRPDTHYSITPLLLFRELE